MSIRLSEKYGVNPCIPKCFFCGENKNELLLFGRINGDIEAPKNTVFDKNPCDKCQEYMKLGVILISVKDGTDNENPYRTGGWCVVKDSAISKFQPQSLVDHILSARVAFVPDEVWNILGLTK